MSKPSPQWRRVQQHADAYTALDFFNALTHPDLQAGLEAQLPAHRERLFPPTETLSMWLAQALSADGSCQQAVDQAATLRLLSGLPLCSTATGGYCQARGRLPGALLQSLTDSVCQAMEADRPTDWLWHGRRVRLIDGTTVTMDDTPANQASYPQQRNQKPGLGYPICRLVAAFDLGHGAVVDAAIGGYQGKGNHEQALLRELLDRFQPGDVLLGDALFSTYFLFAELQARGIDAVFEQHGARRRSTDFRTGKRLGPKDHLITLTKPKKKPDWMSDADYAAAPAQLTVRELATAGKVLVTTLCDARDWPKHQMKALYQQRWDVEINFRYLKTTLGMEHLRAKTPAMNEKALWVYLLAYNVIRWLMASSAKLADVLPRALSFKHTVQLVRHWRAYNTRGANDQDLIEPLLRLVAQPRVGNRPGRIEPRAVKRRPKPYALLTMPRPEARETIRRFGHPKREHGESIKTLPARSQCRQSSHYQSVTA